MTVADAVTQGVAGCAHCNGLGIRALTEGRRASAERCECVPCCTPQAPLLEGCDGRGSRTVRVDGVLRSGRCRCNLLTDRARLFSSAGIAIRHAHSSFENFRHDPIEAPGVAPAYHACLSWVEDFRPDRESRGLLLYGGVGLGKTHLLTAMVRTLTLQHGIPARFVEFSHLLSQLKAGFDAGKGESQVLGPLVDVPVLAIDELGKGRGTDWEITIIDALVSHRYNAMRTTLATTNFPISAPTGAPAGNLSGYGDAPALADRVGERVFSRLRQMCQFLPVRGEDFRNTRRTAQ